VLLGGIFGATTLAALLLMEAKGQLAVIGAAVILGASNGMATLAFATGIGDRYGTASYGTIGALSALFVTGARAAAPVSAAALPLLLAADSLDPALWAAAFASLLAVVLGVASARAPTCEPESKAT
jgi:hypothetical protein